jgi:hypothetical protein
MKMAWSCSRCHGVWRQRSVVRWYELWLRAVSASRPFCCTTCGRRAWSALPEDAVPAVLFTAPVDEARDVSLVAIDAMLDELPPPGGVAAARPLVFDDDPFPARPRRPRAAGKRRRERRADTSVH